MVLLIEYEMYKWMLNTVSGGGYLEEFSLSSLLLQVLFYFRQRKTIPQKSDKAIFFRVEGKKAIFTCWITAWGKKKTKYGLDYDHSD